MSKSHLEEFNQNVVLPGEERIEEVTQRIEEFKKIIETQKQSGRTIVKESHLHENIKDNPKSVRDELNNIQEEVILGPAGFGPGHPKYEGPKSEMDSINSYSTPKNLNNSVEFPKESEAKEQRKIFNELVASEKGNDDKITQQIKEFKNEIEAIKPDSPKEKEEVFLGPAGFGPGHPKYEGPKSEMDSINSYSTPKNLNNSVEFLKESNLSEKLSMHSKRLENNDSFKDDSINMIQSNNSER